MRVVMINDCAHVGETLVKYFPSGVDAMHLKRTRRFWDKTVNIAWKIFRSEGDVYHVNYLLQDCYLTSKLQKRPLIGHAHGSDLRFKTNHPFWGKMIKHNVRKCDKIFVSTPELLGLANKYTENAEYLPNPVDKELFYPRPPRSRGNRLKVLIASRCNFKRKGTATAIRGLSRVNEEIEAYIIQYGKDFTRTLALGNRLGLHLKILQKTPHWKISDYYWNADVVIGNIGIGVLSMVALEAIACGRPVITHVSSEHPEYNEFPLKDVDSVETFVRSFDVMDKELWNKQYKYLVKNHSPEKVTDRVVETYRSLL